MTSSLETQEPIYMFSFLCLFRSWFVYQTGSLYNVEWEDDYELGRMLKKPVAT
jgi:hypothetical protein